MTVQTHGGGRPFIAVIDLETTGFEPPEHAPCEIGRVDLISLRDDLASRPCDWSGISNPFSELIVPGRPMPPEASAIHHLIDGDFAAAMPWSMVRGMLWLESAQLVAFAAHNAGFERKFLTPEIVGDRPWICTWKCALRLWPDAPSHSNQALRYWRKPAGLDRRRADPAHRAGPDAYVTAHLLRDLLELASVADLIKWSGEPALLIRVPFGKTTKGMRWTEVDDGFLDWVIARDFDIDVQFTAQHEIDRREALLKPEADNAGDAP